MYSLASKRHFRYRQLNQRDDLDKAIVHLTESILLSPLSRLQRSPIILTALFSLATALLMRSKVSKRPEDAICATKYLSYLRDHPHDIPSRPRHRVTALLVDALALQVDLEAGNVLQDVREMTVLTHELLETPDVDATDFISLIHAVVISKIVLAVPGQPLDELIEFSRVATKRRPDILQGHMTFAYSLVLRYFMTGVNRDYEEAASILEYIIAYRSPENSQDQFVSLARGFAISYVTVLAKMRSMLYQTPENEEEAIYRARTYFSSPSVKEHFAGSLAYPALTDPEAAAKKRFLHFGSIEGVAESSGNSQADVLSQNILRHTAGCKIFSL